MEVWGSTTLFYISGELNVGLHSLQSVTVTVYIYSVHKNVSHFKLLILTFTPVFVDIFWNTLNADPEQKNADQTNK